MINSTMSSIALGAAHFVVMLRSICYDCSGSRGNALSHTAYFAVQISPAIAASLHSCVSVPAHVKCHGFPLRPWWSPLCESA